MVSNTIKYAHIKVDASVKYTEDQEPYSTTIGYEIRKEEGITKEYCKKIDNNLHNTDAEYYAVLEAIREAKLILSENTKLFIYSDSKDVVDCINPTIKSYPSKNKTKKYIQEIRNLINYFYKVEIKFIPRNLNTNADSLAKKAH